MLKLGEQQLQGIPLSDVVSRDVELVVVKKMSKKMSGKRRGPPRDLSWGTKGPKKYYSDPVTTKKLFSPKCPVTLPIDSHESN